MARRRCHPIVGLVALVAWASIATGAVAANQTVNVGNNRTLSPNSGNATVNLGETVTWLWVGPTTSPDDVGHIIASLPLQAEQ